ncbi:MAG: DNA cytosine methyltransferase [candidate division NC10 bacterium]|nr:DNA cytosine methyltransferase [candidate division NC10 bacterium]
MKTIPIIDLFAGPGGLGEGFAAFQTADGCQPFKIALSIEKDTYAHQTLVLRSFFRHFPPEAVPEEYYVYLRKADEPEPHRRSRLFDAYPEQARRAADTALFAELGVEDGLAVRERINRSLHGYTDFVLLGGPPCQAYSVMGRSRNRGNPGYNATEDKRQRLYVEYLQVLADHHPAIFIMENVKGLLSATLENQRIFERILEDLRSPCEAVAREGRSLADGRYRTRYNLLSLVQSGNGNTEDLHRFIIRMERYGIPQARHRLIILGVRSDLNAENVAALPESNPITVKEVISDLPQVRSGLSRQEDAPGRWRESVRQICSSPFMNGQAVAEGHSVIKAVKEAVESLSIKQLSRGGEFVTCRPHPQYRPDWFVDPRLQGVCNHTTRLHIPADLHRYLYAACYAGIRNRSPELRDFPAELLPEHKNTNQSIRDGAFDDRFRVQISDRPSTTVTSHLAKDGHYFIHPDPSQCRSMTVREVARLQTFPDNYFFCGPRTAQYIQVGNAVPPLLANQIAASVFRFLKECGLAE